MAFHDNNIFFYENIPPPKYLLHLQYKYQNQNKIIMKAHQITNRHDIDTYDIKSRNLIFYVDADVLWGPKLTDNKENQLRFYYPWACNCQKVSTKIKPEWWPNDLE